MCLCDVSKTPRPTSRHTITVHSFFWGCASKSCSLCPSPLMIVPDWWEDAWGIWSCRASSEVTITCVNHLPLIYMRLQAKSNLCRAALRTVMEEVTGGRITSAYSAFLFLVRMLSVLSLDRETDFLRDAVCMINQCQYAITNTYK